MRGGRKLLLPLESLVRGAGREESCTLSAKRDPRTRPCTAVRYSRRVDVGGVCPVSVCTRRTGEEHPHPDPRLITASPDAAAHTSTAVSHTDTGHSTQTGHAGGTARDRVRECMYSCNNNVGSSRVRVSVDHPNHATRHHAPLHDAPPHTTRRRQRCAKTLLILLQWRVTSGQTRVTR